jgi:hypothetical protein
MKTKPSQLIAFIALTQLGCGSLVRDAVKEATPAAISGAVEGLARPDTQRDLLALADESRVKALTHQVSGGVVDGTLDTFEDPARSRRLEELSNRLVDGALATLDSPEHKARIESLVSGIAGSAVATVIDTSLSRTFDEKTQLRLRLAMKATVSELVGVVFESVRAEMGTPEERAKALGSAAHEISKGATLGFQDAIDETKRERLSGEKPKEDGSLLIAASDASATGSRIIWIASIALGFLALLLGIGLAWVIRTNLARRAELEQRDEALLLLTEAIKSTESEPWSNDLRAALKKSMRDRQGGEHIRKVLRDKRGLRLGSDAVA